jgi:hypothetical protein
MNRVTPPSLARYGSELEAAIRRDIDAPRRRWPGTPRPAYRIRFGRLWTAIGASGTLLAAAITAAVLLLSSGAPPAYAGYSSAPAQPSRAALSAATKSCDVLAAGYSAIADGTFAHRPVLAEQRGVYVAAVEVRGGRVYSCLTSGSNGMRDIGTFGRLQGEPAPQHISAPYWLQAGAGSLTGPGPSPLRQVLNNETPAERKAFHDRSLGAGYGLYALGRVGNGVSSITFSFADEEAVSATVENGWYFAWWPWTSDATSVTVGTRSGAVTSPLHASANFPAAFRPSCVPGSSGCVFSAQQG